MDAARHIARLGRIGWFALLTATPGCTWITGVDVPEQTLPAACGLCIYQQPSPAGCYWAVEYEGKTYAVNGPTPPDHDAHGPEGMCTMERRAKVAGTIRGEQIFATTFELLPVDPSAVPTDPPKHDHAHDGVNRRAR